VADVSAEPQMAFRKDLQEAQIVWAYLEAADDNIP
jgi:hypothetical protein